MGFNADPQKSNHYSTVSALTENCRHIFKSAWVRGLLQLMLTEELTKACGVTGNWSPAPDVNKAIF